LSYWRTTSGYEVDAVIGNAQVLEQMLQKEMDAHLGYEKNDVSGNNTGNSRNGSFQKFSIPLYCIASARWIVVMYSEWSRSAIVRATFKIL